MSKARVIKEFKNMKEEHDVNINKKKEGNGTYCFVLSQDCLQSNNIKYYHGWLNGPLDSAYEDGQFEFELTLNDEHPFKPPKFKFKTKIYHPNIDDDVGVCLDILKSQWSPALTVSKVLSSVRSLLNDPNPDDPLRPDASNLFKSNKELYLKEVAKYMWSYALSNDIIEKYKKEKNEMYSDFF